jgi:hypothetical protein
LHAYQEMMTVALPRNLPDTIQNLKEQANQP